MLDMVRTPEQQENIRKFLVGVPQPMVQPQPLISPANMITPIDEEPSEHDVMAMTSSRSPASFLCIYEDHGYDRSLLFS